MARSVAAGVALAAIVSVGVVAVRLSEVGWFHVVTGALTMLAAGGAAAVATANLVQLSGASRTTVAARPGSVLAGAAGLLFFLLGVVLLVAGTDPEWFLVWLCAITAVSAAVIGWVTPRRDTAS